MIIYYVLFFLSIFTSTRTHHSFSDTGSVKMGHLAEDDGESDVFPAPAPPAAAAPQPVYEGPMPTAPQRAFQPGSTPVHLMHRFMVRSGKDEGPR